MRRAKVRLGAFGVLAVAGALAGGCTRNDPNELVTNGTTGAAEPCPVMTGSGATTGASTGATTGAGTGGSATTGATTGAGTGGGPVVPVHTVLDDRVLDYNEALRTASFKLVGNAPTMDQITNLRNAPDPKTAYESMVDQMMADTRFAVRMVAFWKNTFRMGGAAAGPKPSRDTAPTFAARITVEGTLPYTAMFTATTNTCPTFDGSKFTDGNCVNGPITAGLLTDPGVHHVNWGNLGFLRNRWIQETFACRKQPAELSATPIPMGAGNYTAPWPFDSIAGAANGGRVDFLDTSSAICANCHATANHRAPLFANYDANGQYQPTIQVMVPIVGTPLAVMSDWLPPGQTTAWKLNQPAADIGEMGARMAADPEVINCGVQRMWNYAMSKGDIVNDASDVPTQVIAPYIADFNANGFLLKNTLRAMLVGPDFVRF